MQPWAGDEPTLYVTNQTLGVMAILNGDARRRELTAYTDLRFPRTRDDSGIDDNNRTWSIAVDNGLHVLHLHRNAGENSLTLVPVPAVAHRRYVDVHLSVTLSEADARRLGARIRAALAEHATSRTSRAVTRLSLPNIAVPYNATRTVYTWQVPDDDDSSE